MPEPMPSPTPLLIRYRFRHYPCSVRGRRDEDAAQRIPSVAEFGERDIGGPTIVDSICNLGSLFRTTMAGGVIWVRAKRGASPFETGSLS